jgi:hypothetical protein
METTLETEERRLSDAMTSDSLHLSRHVRQLARSLREKTEASPFAADTLVLANEVESLCDYIDQLHGNVQNLLAKIETSDDSDGDTPAARVTPEDRKAIEIQRETHELHPTLKDTIKALFMWRDSPEQRLRDDK